MDDGILESSTYVNHLVKHLEANPPSVVINSHDAAVLFMGKCNLSQRSYKNLKKILKQQHVELPRYEEVILYIKNLDVGKLYREDSHLNCMCVRSDMQDTLHRIMNCELGRKAKFLSTEEQSELIKFLKQRDPLLYSNLDSRRRTLFVRETGDNFRASARFPTEQVSFSLMNFPDLLNSPYGQFVISLWRGSENRENLLNHLSGHFKELEEIVHSGLEIFVDAKLETFNVVVILCTDLGLLDKLLGKCGTTSKYGCYWCCKLLKNWSETAKTKGTPQEIKEMLVAGEKAVKELGDSPSHYSKEFTKFQQANKGQYVSKKSIAFI